MSALHTDSGQRFPMGDNDQHQFFAHEGNDHGPFNENSDIDSHEPVTNQRILPNVNLYGTSPIPPSLDSPTQHTDNQTEESTA